MTVIIDISDSNTTVWKELKEIKSYDDVSSGWRKIKNGVSQVSILGPLLLLIYINVLSVTTDSDIKVMLFADDTSIIITGANQDRLQTALKKLVPI